MLPHTSLHLPIPDHTSPHLIYNSSLPPPFPAPPGDGSLMLRWALGSEISTTWTSYRANRQDESGNNPSNSGQMWYMKCTLTGKDAEQEVEQKRKKERKWSRSGMSDSLGPHGLQPTRLLPSMGFSRQEYWSGVPFSFSRGSSWPRNRTQVSHIVDRRFTIWATREV